jgi:hypothetical protein
MTFRGTEMNSRIYNRLFLFLAIIAAGSNTPLLAGFSKKGRCNIEREMSDGRAQAGNPDWDYLSDSDLWSPTETSSLILFTLDEIEELFPAFSVTQKEGNLKECPICQDANIEICGFGPDFFPTIPNEECPYIYLKKTNETIEIYCIKNNDCINQKHHLCIACLIKWQGDTDSLTCPLCRASGKISLIATIGIAEPSEISMILEDRITLLEEQFLAKFEAAK